MEQTLKAEDLVFYKQQRDQDQTSVSKRFGQTKRNDSQIGLLIQGQQQAETSMERAGKRQYSQNVFNESLNSYVIHS